MISSSSPPAAFLNTVLGGLEKVDLLRTGLQLAVSPHCQMGPLGSEAEDLCQMLQSLGDDCCSQALLVDFSVASDSSLLETRCCPIALILYVYFYVLISSFLPLLLLVLFSRHLSPNYHLFVLTEEGRANRIVGKELTVIFLKNQKSPLLTIH